MNNAAIAKGKIDVVLGDGNALMLSALSEKVQRDSRFSLVATVSSAENFISTVMRLPVTVGVIDWSLPVLGGQRMIEALRDQAAAPRIVVYADDNHGDLSRRALAAGAAGFCSRAKPVEELLDAIATVADGNMVFPFLDIRDLQADPVFQLTRRERGLLEAMAQGRTNKELASEFSLSVNTVKFHLSNLYDKLSVKNRTQAIAFYFSAQMSGDWAASTK
ncbi:MAG: LuxR C-terminal-related transcriptional regulator [Pikeienuella sp.]